MTEHLRISHSIGKSTELGSRTMCLVLGPEAWHHSTNDDMVDDGASSAISSLAAASSQ